MLATQEHARACAAAEERGPRPATQCRSELGAGAAARTTLAHSDGDKCVLDKTPELGTAPHHSTEGFSAELFVGSPVTQTDACHS